MSCAPHFFCDFAIVRFLRDGQSDSDKKRGSEMKILKVMMLAGASAFAASAACAMGHETETPTTAIVTFQLPEGMTEQQARDLYLGSAQTFADMPELTRKYYLFDEETSVGGGVYLWESREAAEALYTPEWRAGLAERLGSMPQVQYFTSPVIIDNATNEIWSAPDAHD